MKTHVKHLYCAVSLISAALAVTAPQIASASDADFRTAKDINVFSEGIAAFQDAYTEKWGYIDMEGNVVIDPEWDVADACSEGYVRVGLRYDDYSVYGYLDAAGTYVTPILYDGGSDASEGYGLLRYDNRYVYINMENGEELFGKSFKEAHSFHGGYASAADDDGQWGFIDTSGVWVISPQFDGASHFSEGLAAVEKDGLWGFINESGEPVIDCQFDDYSSFSDGYAAVESNDLEGYIDSTGAIVIPLEYDSATSFRDGRAWVKKDGMYFMIDKNGNRIGDHQWENVHRGISFTLVYEGDKRGYVNSNNELQLPAIYDDATPFREDGIAAVQRDGRWYLIDQNGIDILDGTDTTK